jgi:hypothetical protein
MTFDELRRVGMDMQFAETTTEVLVLLGRQLLVPEEDDEVVQQGLMDFLKLLIADLAAEIDTEDFGADGGCKLTHLDGLVGHGWYPPPRDIGAPGTD